MPQDIRRERVHMKRDGQVVEFDAIVVEKKDGTFGFIRRSEEVPCQCKGDVMVYARKEKAE